MLAPVSMTTGQRLIGRDDELRSLLGRLDGVSSDGRAIWLVGEPGIGKSALLAGVAEQARSLGLHRAERAGQPVGDAPAVRQPAPAAAAPAGAASTDCPPAARARCSPASAWWRRRGQPVLHLSGGPGAARRRGERATRPGEPRRPALDGPAHGRRVGLRRAAASPANGWSCCARRAPGRRCSVTSRRSAGSSWPALTTAPRTRCCTRARRDLRAGPAPPRASRQAGGNPLALVEFATALETGRLPLDRAGRRPAR